jgi:hypothetical protein
MKRVYQMVLGLLLVGVVGACERKGGPLRVDDADPSRGTTGGGEHVTINGSGFEPGKTQVEVRFGRRKAENVTIASASKITVVTPPGDRGPVDITLMFDDGTPFKIAAGFTYVLPAGTEDVRKAYFSGQTKPAAPSAKPAP